MNNVRNGDFQLDPAYGPSSSGGGGGGEVVGLVAGQNILIDVTDPTHPKISLGITEAPGMAVIPDGGGPGVDLIVITADANSAIQLIAGGVSVRSTGSPLILTANDQDVRIIGTKPLLLPQTEDSGASLDAAAYRGSIIYDLTSDSLLYSNGTDWVHFIASVDAGTGIAVDASQPAHPIVSVSP